MRFESTPFEDVFIIEMQPHQDDRGWFSRTFCKKAFQTIGFEEEWVQMNHSFNKKKGTLRGMHFQNSPFSETKLVRCIAGAIYDVIVDIRANSPTFLSWFGVELSATNHKMLFIPDGYAHGFQTLKKNTQLLYNHTEAYSPEAEDGLRFDDPMIGVKWPMPPAMISLKDQHHLYLDEEFTGIEFE